ISFVACVTALFTSLKSTPVVTSNELELAKSTLLGSAGPSCRACARSAPRLICDFVRTSKRTAAEHFVAHRIERAALRRPQVPPAALRVRQPCEVDVLARETDSIVRAHFRNEHGQYRERVRLRLVVDRQRLEAPHAPRLEPGLFP